MNKMMALLIHVGPNTAQTVYPEFVWDEDLWQYILTEAPKAGLNTVVIDVDDGVEYATHPEIALKGAWSRGELKKHLGELRAAGLTPIPKLNFATTHSMWLGEYHRMTSTHTYYKVANDLIREVYELFDGPEYIHLGMDEESEQYAVTRDYVIFRQGELYWHDLRFLVDSVKETGATPWVWSSPLFDNPEEFKKHFAPDEMIFSPYMYNAFRRDHWTPINTRSEYMVYYNEGKYKEMGFEYVEQDPYIVNFMNVVLPLMKEGYKYVPCASVFNRCDWNHHDMLEYFKENAPDDQILGYMSAPWKRFLPSTKPYFEETFKFFKEAIDDFYK